MLLLCNVALWAVPARRAPLKVTQPDGTVITIVLNGDEHFRYLTTEDGLLIKKSSDGYYRFALMNSEGELQETNFICREPNQRSKAENIFIEDVLRHNNFREISHKVRLENIEKKASKMPAMSQERRTSRFIGDQKYLVLLIGYKDLGFRSTRTYFDNMMNQKGFSANGAIGSAKDYFEYCSNGKFRPQFDVYGPYTAKNNMSYYGRNVGGSDANAEALVIEACQQAAAQGVNLKQYDLDGDGYIDNVCVYYAGYSEAEHAPSDAIWPHSYAVYGSPNIGGVRVKKYIVMSELRRNYGTKNSGIGAFCHEFSHYLGLADLYNTDNSGQTVYDWDLMDGGCYNGPIGNDRNSEGDVPAGHSAHQRFYLGWLTPEILNENGKYSLTALGETDNNSFLISENPDDTHNLDGENPNPKNFFLLENRQRKSFDSYLPASGMLIWRIMFNSDNWYYNSPNNSKPYGMDIIEADGRESMDTQDKDPFPQANKTAYKFTSYTSNSWGKEVKNITRSGEKITFDFINDSTGYTNTEASATDFIIGTLENNSWIIEALVKNGEYRYCLYSVAGELLSKGDFHSTAVVSSSNLSVGSYILWIENVRLKPTALKKYTTVPVLKTY